MAGALVAASGLTAATAVAGLIGTALTGDTGGGVAADPGERPRSVTVRAHCSSGGGTIVLRHTSGSGATRVSIDGAGLRPGRWTGEHLLEVGVDDTHDTRLRLRAPNGTLHRELEIPDAGPAGILQLRGPAGAECSASFDESRPWVIVGGARESVVVRHPRPRLLRVNGQIDCPPGSDWSVEVSVAAGGGGSGAGQEPVHCPRRGFLRFRWETRSGAATPKPVGVRYVGRDLGTGEVRRVSYRATRPSPWGLPG